jgi:hypothetical protein
MRSVWQKWRPGLRAGVEDSVKQQVLLWCPPPDSLRCPTVGGLADLLADSDPSDEEDKRSPGRTPFLSWRGSCVHVRDEGSNDHRSAGSSVRGSPHGRGLQGVPVFVAQKLRDTSERSVRAESLYSQVFNETFPDQAGGFAGFVGKHTVIGPAFLLSDSMQLQGRPHRIRRI